MKALLIDLESLQERLERMEDPKTDSAAWLIRELAEVLARAHGILEALANTEDQ
ncbi:MAG TPA: hypothetical protein VM120_26035 [Bryobacteraceae bacterium]|nr:hypothetical protein [Bryobacteraceae bacterium]